MNKDQLQRLVALESSLARDVKLALLDLAGALTQAIENKPNDLATNDCKELLKDLKQILFHTPRIDSPQFSSSNDPPFIHPTQPLNLQDVLEPVSKSSSRFEQSAFFERSLPDPSETPQSHEPSPSHPSNLKLNELRQNIISDATLKPYLLEPGAQSIHLPTTSDTELWQAIQLLCLRLPERLAQLWQQQVLITAEAVSAVKETSGALGHLIPSNHDDGESFPGLTGTITAPGLYFSSKATSKALASEDWTKEVQPLSRIVSTLLKLVELDSQHLHHALKSIDIFGVRSLQSLPERLKYTNALVDRLCRVQTAENQGDVLSIFQARLDLDEAIHSLVYLPPSIEIPRGGGNYNVRHAEP